jgi:Inner membrane component of T3SS, cytoplasmic domain
MGSLCGHMALRPSAMGWPMGAVSKHCRMLDFRAVDSFRLRFSNQPHADLVLGAGVHGIGHVAGGMIGPIDATAGMGEALVQLCVDRRGVWMKLGQKARAVHVNGRPVRQMAMLRVGDAIYLEGAELLLLGLRSAAATSLPAAAPTSDEADARIVLRGVGGQYHGRSFTLSRPLLVGSGADCDIRIDDPAFAERHARIERNGDQVLLRDHGAGDGSMVNGELVRDAYLHPGDQVVFDAHQRFVVEAPGRPGHARAPLAQTLDEIPGPAYEPRAESAPRNARRLPWLLLAALLIAVGLSALLLFGTTA